jgi:hypothetical protein
MTEEDIRNAFSGNKRILDYLLKNMSASEGKRDYSKNSFSSRLTFGFFQKNSQVLFLRDKITTYFITESNYSADSNKKIHLLYHTSVCLLESLIPYNLPSEP